MKIKKLMLLALPAVALTLGIVALNTPSNIDCSPAEAADYTPSNRKITFNSDKSVSATFSVNDNVLDSRGWLLCLFTSKPSFDPVTHKINGSADMHPYSTTACAHYFFAANSTKEGNISVTWSKDFTDQKENGKWSDTESIVEGGHTLEYYLNQETDWYIVVGIRHFNNSWGTDGNEPGEGTNGWWENADYYAGRKSVIKGNLPYGEIYLDLTEYRAWEDASAKFGVYFFDGNNNDAFSDIATAAPSEDGGIYIASYELTFQPTHMIGLRLNSTCTTPNWDDKWGQTKDLTFYQYGVIGVTSFDAGDKKYNGWSDGLATVKITRGSQEIEVALDNYKRNAEGKSEHYNDYIDLQKNDEFVIEYGSTSYYSYDSLEIFDNNFSLDNTKIKVNVAGTYSFYFKAYETEQVHHDVFISKPEVAFADAWALAFLDGTSGTCDATKENWSTYEDEFDDLPHSAKEFLLTVEHEPDPTVEFENYFARAIQRYDYVIYLYGTDAYNDYIGRVEAGKFTPRSSNSLVDGVFSNESSTQITLVIIVSVASLTSLCGCLVLKKRKASN